MSGVASRYTYALSVWKRRWIAQKKRDLFLIVAMGICFTVFIAANYVLSSNRDSLFAMILVITVFPFFSVHEIWLLRRRMNAQVTVNNCGFLVEKKNHSQHEIVRAQHTRGCYVTIRTTSGDIEAICDSRTYVHSKIGDPMMVIKVEKDSSTYATAINPN